MNYDYNLIWMLNKQNALKTRIDFSNSKWFIVFKIKQNKVNVNKNLPKNKRENWKITH